jgi:hypothetical protein
MTGTEFGEFKKFDFFGAKKEIKEDSNSGVDE